MWQGCLAQLCGVGWHGPATKDLAAEPSEGLDSGRSFENILASTARSKASKASNSGSLSIGQQTSYGFTFSILLLCMMVGAAKGSSAVCLYMGVLLLFLGLGDLLYSRFLATAVFQLSHDEVTPAHQPEFAAHPDFAATPAFILFGHHWTSITGAAPIIGPAIACYYGWLPAMVWVVLGGLLGGGVHDFGVLAVSARNNGRSIADLAGAIVSWRMRVVFLLLIMFLCWIVIAVFMNAIAKLFMANPETVLPVNAEIPLAALMGMTTRFATRTLSPSRVKALVMVLSLLMLVLLYGLVFAGVAIEESKAKWVDGKNVDPVFGWALHAGKGSEYTIQRQLCRDSVNFKTGADGSPAEATCSFGAMQFWTIFLTLYGFIASVIPVWVVLQPRDFINSHQLKLCMALLILGLLVKGPAIDAAAMRSAVDESAAEKSPIWPMLFTTIACGAVSGFHGLVGSGVTSKQLDRMPDARAIGYSGMLGESALAALVIVVCCSSGSWATAYESYPVNWAGAFVPAAAALLEEVGIGTRQARAIVIVLVVSFAATTLDSGMRIQRILVGEMGGLVETRVPLLGRLLRNTLVAGLVSAVPACLLANSRIVSSLWNLFGATNQLLACISLITVAIYVWRYRRFQVRYVIPFLLPVLWLGIFISWALSRTIRDYLDPQRRPSKEIDWLTTVPTYPSIIMVFCIAAGVIMILLEVLWYFVSGSHRTDQKISDQGNIGRDFPNLGCC